MNQLPSLSIFFPSLNDAKILPYILAKTYAVAPTVARRFEVIVINDGSTDDTKEILKELTKHYPRLRVITHKKNRGYGGALISGFTSARKDWIFYTDGDGQYDPMELPKLVKAVRSGVDVVNGYKVKRGDSWYRVLVGILYNRLIQALYHPPIRDIDCDFRLIRRSLLKKITLTSTSGTICVELIMKLKAAGARFAEVGIHHYPRPFGRSQFFRLPRLLKALSEHFNFLKTSPLNPALPRSAESGQAGRPKG